MKIKGVNSIFFFASVVLFKLALDLSYTLILSDGFAYVGYHLNFDGFRYFSSWVLYLVSFKLLEPKFNYVKDYFFLTAVLAVLGPLLVLWGLDYRREIFPVFVSFTAIFLIYFTYAFFLRSRSVKLPRVKHGISISFFISVVLVLFLIVWYPVSGVSYNLNFAKVYEYRTLNAELSTFGLLIYLNTWIFKVFAVFLLAYGLLRKWYFFAAFMVLVFILFFAANTHKSVFFTPFLIVSFWLYFSRFNSLFIVPLGFSTLVLLSIFSYYYIDDVWMSALFPNRVFEMPAHLTFQYFEFFKENEFIYFSNSFLKSFVEYPYNLGLANLIGEYNGNADENANNGYISSAYAQAGIIVVYLYSVIIGLILTVIDKMIIKGEIKAWFALVIFMVPLRDFLISADFLTTMLTGGMIWSLLLIYMVRNRPSTNGVI